MKGNDFTRLIIFFVLFFICYYTWVSMIYSWLRALKFYGLQEIWKLLALTLFFSGDLWKHLFVDHCNGQISDVVAAAFLLLFPLLPPSSSLIFTPLFESSILNYFLWSTPLCMLHRVVGMGMTPPAVQDGYQNGLSHSEYINPVHKDLFMAWAHDQSQWNL